MDLNRLRISEQTHAPSTGRASILIALIICLPLGFLAGFFWRGSPQSNVRRVRTVVARPGQAGGSKRFVAGGWVEAAYPQYPVWISAHISERIEAILVKDGDIVMPGQEIARLYDKDRKVALEIAKAKHLAATEELAKLNKGYRKEVIEAARATATVTAERKRIARLNLERARKIGDAITQQEVDQKESIYKAAEAQHRRAQSELAKFTAGYRSEDIAVAKAVVEQAKAELRLAQQNLDHCTIRVPEGERPLRVLRVHRAVGEWLNSEKKSDILSLYDPANMQVRVDVSQSNIRNVIPGAPVQILTEAGGETVYKGTVLRLEPLAELAKNTIRVRARINEPDGMLFPEMVAQITFLSAGSEEEAPGLFLPANAVYTDDDKQYVALVLAGQVQRRAVKTGRTVMDRIEILEGIAPGQRVVADGADTLPEGALVEEVE